MPANTHTMPVASNVNSSVCADTNSCELDSCIYLDYAATAPLRVCVAEAMEPYFVPGAAGLAFSANANSLHSPGRAAFAALEEARRTVACAVGANRPSEIVFTSGATEADNAALIGIAHAAADARKRSGISTTPQVIVSAIEHDAVLEPAKQLEREGFRVTRLSPNHQGFIEAETLQAVLDTDTVLVSIQMANSELGSIQPVADLARGAHAAGALIHTDAVQALGKIPVDVQALNVDAASFSAHKIGGPKGVGALYLKARTPFSAQMLGGGQEEGRRSGTQNVAGAAGFAAACQAASAEQPTEAQRLGALRDKLYEALFTLDGVTPTVAVVPGSTEFLPNIVHVLVKGLESETLVMRFDKLGFCVSGGSACASHSLEPSHVLRALGISTDKAHNALRISLGYDTTEQDVDDFIAAMPRVLNWI